MASRRDRPLLILLATSLALVAVLATVLVVQVVQRRSRVADVREQVAAADTAPAVPVDPYAARGDEAETRVRETAVAGATIGARVEERALEQRVEIFDRAGVERLGWTSRRTSVPSIYAVRHAYRFHSVEFGPEWFVQLDPEGRMPEGSNGVVPANALAEHLHRADLDENVRPLNRSDEVLQALTEHVFEGGSRLGSALLVHFRGGDDVLSVDDTIGWVVVPELADDGGESLVYRAYFQWMEEGEANDAWWEIDLSSREFLPRDIQANRIMERGAEVDPAAMIDIRPRTIDLDTPPEAESDPRRRALRYVLADARRVEAVQALMTYRGRTTELQYDGWELNVTDQRHVYDVACRFREGANELRVSWRVRAADGAVTPTSPLAEMASLVLTLPATTTPE